MSKARFFGVVALTCAVAVMAGGCRSNKAKTSKGPTEGPLFPTIKDTGPGPGELSGRFEQGKPIPGSESAAVLFAFDSALIAPTEEPKVGVVADCLKNNAQAKVTLEGHCDERGSAEYNLALGERRALAVRASLMRSGVDGSRIQTKSLGKEMPADPGHNEDAWRKNRRVEFRVTQ